MWWAWAPGGKKGNKMQDSGAVGSTGELLLSRVPWGADRMQPSPRCYRSERKRKVKLLVRRAALTLAGNCWIFNIGKSDKMYHGMRSSLGEQID